MFLCANVLTCAPESEWTVEGEGRQSGQGGGAGSGEAWGAVLDQPVAFGAK